MNSLALMLRWLLSARVGLGRQLQGPIEFRQPDGSFLHVKADACFCFAGFASKRASLHGPLEPGKRLACATRCQKKYSRCAMLLLAAREHEEINPLLLSERRLLLFALQKQESRGDNPLLLSQGLRDGMPRFRPFDAADTKSAFETVNQELKDDWQKLQDELVAQSTSAGLLEALEKMLFPGLYTGQVYRFLQNVGECSACGQDWDRANKEQKEWITRNGLNPPQGDWDSADKAINDYDETYDSIMQSRVLYDALANLESDKLSRSQQRVVELKLRNMREYGVHLTDADKDEYCMVVDSLAKLAAKYVYNIQASPDFELILTDPADVDGLTPGMRAAAAESYLRSRSKNGANTWQSVSPSELGPWRLDGDSYFDAMAWLTSSKVREKLFRAGARAGAGVASEGQFDNRPVIEEMLKLRQKKAHLLGFENFAELQLSNQMLPDVAAVEDFISQIYEKAKPAAEREAANLHQFAQSQGHEGELQIWDLGYWKRRLGEGRFASWKVDPQFYRRQVMSLFRGQIVQGENLRDYSAFPVVLDALFRLASELFGVQLMPLREACPQHWYFGISCFRVVDKSTREDLGFLYLDPYRPSSGIRRSEFSAQCTTVIDRSKAMGTKPIAYVELDIAPPSGEKPALLRISEVVTLFHEFGHAMQSLLTDVDESDINRIGGLEWDAVELPSKFMEKWIDHRQTFFSFAKHWQTGDLISADYFEKFKDQKYFCAGLNLLGKVQEMKLDLELHKQDFEASGESPFDVERRIYKEMGGVFQNAVSMDEPDEGTGICCNTHLADSKYASAYYSYTWSDVLASDAFAAFEKTFEDDEALEAIGRRWRQTVLGSGASKPAGEVYRDFLGRDACVDNFLRDNGIMV